VAGVGKFDGIARFHLGEEIALDRNRCVLDVTFAQSSDESNARRLRHPTYRVAHRPPLRHRGARLDDAGAKLGSGKIERERTSLARLALRTA